MKVLLNVQLVPHNVVLVKLLFLTVLLVVVLELQLQTVHVHPITIPKLIILVDNVTIGVLNVAITPTNVPIVQPLLTDLFYHVCVMPVTMMPVLKSVNHVTLNVPLVPDLKIVTLVLVKESMPQNVSAQLVLTLMLTSSVNLVTILVQPVTLKLIPVIPVLVTELMLQTVPVLWDTSMMVPTQFVLDVPKDVLPVLLVLNVPLVPEEELMPHTVPVH